jgi:phosphoribosylformimino-5-aminoimidazole carboxamide ribotide isomerase
MTMKIIPAIDIINGRCVRLTKGDYSTEKIYHIDPIEMAKYFEDKGFHELHIVDLDAAKGTADNLKLVYRIIKDTKLKVQLGGGIRTKSILDKVMQQGIDKAIIGSAAVKQPQEVFDWISQYGNETIIVGADVRSEMITTDGWHQTSNMNVIDFIKMYMDNGAIQFLCTDVSKDGLMKGIAEKLYSDILVKYPNVKLIASGGVGHLQDVEKAQSIGIYALVIGKALYENKILPEALIKSIQ